MAWDFINTKYVEARKPHVCEECKATIAVGERHAYTAGKVEGYLEQYRLCMTCEGLAMAWCELVNEEGWGLGELRTQLAEEGVESPYDEFLAKASAQRAARSIGYHNERIADRVVKGVLAERRRQLVVEGCTAQHDDEHVERQIALAAAALLSGDIGCEPPTVWVSPGRDWRRRVEIAAALCLAELERLDRAEASI